MAFSKSDQYLEELHLLSEFMKAFGHSARLEIIEQLCQDGICNVDELYRNHPIARSTFSGHLEILRDTHLVTWEERFPFTYYRVNLEMILFAIQLIKKFFGNILTQLHGVEKLEEMFKVNGGVEGNDGMVKEN